MLCLRLNREIEGALLQLPVWELRGEGAGYKLQGEEGEPSSWTVPGVGEEEKESLQCGDWLRCDTHLPRRGKECRNKDDEWPVHISDLVITAALGGPMSLERDGQEVLKEVRE